MQDDREGRARHTLKVYCLSRWNTEYKTVKDTENELISRLEVDGMPEQVLPLRVRMSACSMPSRKESMRVFFNAYKCICARACTGGASERMCRDQYEALGSAKPQAGAPVMPVPCYTGIEALGGSAPQAGELGGLPCYTGRLPGAFGASGGGRTTGDERCGAQSLREIGGDERCGAQSLREIGGDVLRPSGSQNTPSVVSRM